MTNQPADVNHAAARKMAIVDALKPAQRAIVWDMGLYDFSIKHPKAYKAAKARAGIKGPCAFSQRATPAQKGA
jgi:hypothetical protein